MATAESVRAKIQGLIGTANATTGNADSDLTTAVNALVAGFGQGGENYIDYAVNGKDMFAGVVLPENVNIVLGSKHPDLEASPYITSMFYKTSGVKNLKFDFGYKVLPCSLDTLFRGCSAETIEAPFLETVAMTTYNRCFQDCTNLKEIKTPINASASQSFARCFDFDNVNNILEEVRFVSGTIRTYVSFNGSKFLSDKSIQSIIDGLADLTGSTAQTLTFNKTVGAKLTDTQKASASAKNWTISY